MHRTQIVRCPNCGSLANRHFIDEDSSMQTQSLNRESELIRTECPVCDYLMVMRSVDGKVLEVYVPSVSPVRCGELAINGAVGAIENTNAGDEVTEAKHTGDKQITSQVCSQPVDSRFPVTGQRSISNHLQVSNLNLEGSKQALPSFRNNFTMVHAIGDNAAVSGSENSSTQEPAA